MQWVSLAESCLRKQALLSPGVETGYPATPEPAGHIDGTPASLLRFVLTPDLEKALTSARADFDARRGNVDVLVNTCTAVNKVSLRNVSWLVL